MTYLEERQRAIRLARQYRESQKECVKIAWDDIQRSKAELARLKANGTQGAIIGWCKAEIQRSRGALRRTNQDSFRRKVKLIKKIHEMAEDGKLYVFEWGRDCDMCESSSVTEIEANYYDYKRFEHMIYSSAEGPAAVKIITKEQAGEFVPEFRDRAMEAFEDGRGANAYSV